MLLPCPEEQNRYFRSTTSLIGSIPPAPVRWTRSTCATKESNPKWEKNYIIFYFISLILNYSC